MKKFLLHILLFFAIVAVTDAVAGQVFHYLQSAVAKGRTKVEYHACRESNEGIIIMGSSRASHHYVPKILADSLGMECFNAGQDGNGIILQYGRWRMISERYSPKLIIYDITPNFDVALNDNMTYVDRLKPFCDDKNVKGYISDVFPMENIKLFSKMYRFNYKFLEILSDCATGKDISDGYAPLDGLIRKEIVDQTEQKRANIMVDNIKLRYLEQLVVEAKEKGTKVVFVLSPSFRGVEKDLTTINEVKAISERNNILFWDFSNDEMCKESSLFYDSVHLNAEGAELFTKKLISLLTN